MADGGDVLVQSCMITRRRVPLDERTVPTSVICGGQCLDVVGDAKQVHRSCPRGRYPQSQRQPERAKAGKRARGRDCLDDRRRQLARTQRHVRVPRRCQVHRVRDC